MDKFTNPNWLWFALGIAFWVFVFPMFSRMIGRFKSPAKADA